MIKANNDDRQLVIEILAKSFEDNKTVNYIVKRGGNMPKRIRALMDYSFRICSLFGEVWLSDDKQACALVLYPHLKKTTFRSICLDLKLIFSAIGLAGIFKTMRREDFIKAKRPNVEMLYLWFIGVNPTHQHSGIGSGLLREVIADAECKCLPAFLETSTLQNLSWYQHFGFQVYAELTLTYTMYFLKHELTK